MKEFVKSIINKFGYTAVKSSYYKKLVNINTLSDIDCHYILKKIITKEQEICCFDVGANVSQTAKKLRKHYPKASIYCFEPMKKTYEELKSNVSFYSNITAYNLAMGSQIEEKEVYYQENSEWNSLIAQNNEHAKNSGAISETILVTTLDTFVKDNKIERIEFFKSDTEGFELEVLKGAVNCLTTQMVEILYFEVGFSKSDRQHTYWIEIAEYLEKYNYAFSGLFEVSYTSNMQMIYANALFFSNRFVSRLR